ncbi:MAG: glycosyltransferase family 39 protein [Verrucomicrobia bacterium]|nr:glycosyltransferase family 39 protein [Verrucomicrobiota bacterium]
MNEPLSPLQRAAVAFLLLLHLALGLGAVVQKSVTVDEIFHLTGGYCFNALGDFRVHPDNGVLPQRLHALPAVLMGAQPPRLEGNPYWQAADSYVLSYQFFYESGHDHWPLLLGARAMNSLFGVAVLLLVFAWARRLAGAAAGFTALGLGALSPTLLAHGPLATTDVAAALLLTASAGAFWSWLRNDGGGRLAVSAAVFGVACVTKYSAVLLLPIFGGLTVIHALTTPRSAWQPRRILLGLVAHGAAAVAIIWACFGFRYRALAPDLPTSEHFTTSWAWMLDRAGWQGSVLRAIAAARLLPEAFLWGYTHTYLGSLERGAYLAGEFSNTGWRSFFPLAFLWKSTPAELSSVLAIMAAAVLRRHRLAAWIVRLSPLLLLVAVYGGVALTSRLNIGHRHLLPLYPALFILAGVAVSRLAAWSRRPAWLGTGLGLAAQAVSALTCCPHFLAYFNVTAGGSDRAWRLLVDSSLDWGQDLRGLKIWLERQSGQPGSAPVYLSYFGSGEPAYYGLKVRRLPFVNGFKLATSYVPLEAGTYCISATTLVQVYSVVRGPWTLEWEKEYQQLRSLEPLFAEYATNPRRRAELERDAPADQWRRSWTRFDLLRFARLCHYLRVRHPEDHVGHSVLIYRLTAAEVAAATAGSLAEWQQAIERAAAGKP